MSSGLTQSKIGTGLQAGVNRIGLYADASLVFLMESHQVQGGIRYYGPDYVFESNNIGMSVGYNYLFSANKWSFGPGLHGAFFHENKSTVELTLSELLLEHRLIYHFRPNFAVHQWIGLGAVLNKHTNYLIGTTSLTSYLNYEFAIGFIYYWRSATDSQSGV